MSSRFLLMASWRGVSPSESLFYFFKFKEISISSPSIDHHINRKTLTELLDKEAGSLTSKQLSVSNHAQSSCWSAVKMEMVVVVVVVFETKTPTLQPELTLNLLYIVETGFELLSLLSECWDYRHVLKSTTSRSIKYIMQAKLAGLKICLKLGEHLPTMHKALGTLSSITRSGHDNTHL